MLPASRAWRVVLAGHIPSWSSLCSLCDAPMSSRDSVMEARERPGYCQPCHEQLMDEECHKCWRALGPGSGQVQETSHTQHLCTLCDTEGEGLKT